MKQGNKRDYIQINSPELTKTKSRDWYDTESLLYGDAKLVTGCSIR